jgi:hypothetical protein
VSKRLSDGRTKATFCPAIASLSAPTVAELTAAGIVACEEYITADGLSISIEQGPGRTLAQIELTYFRDSVLINDRMWSVMTNGTEGYLVVRRGVAYDVAYAAGQKVAIYTVTCGESREVAPEAETYDRAMLNLYPSGPYLREATVAA